jgi:hypothetical protein
VLLQVAEISLHIRATVAALPASFNGRLP